jgi:hypothetical protein
VNIRPPRSGNTDRSEIIGAYAAAADARILRSQVGSAFDAHHVCQAALEQVYSGGDANTRHAWYGADALQDLIVKASARFPFFVALGHQVERSRDDIVRLQAGPHLAHTHEALRQQPSGRQQNQT